MAVAGLVEELLIDRTAETPLHEQLGRQIRERIARGDVQPGEKLPSVQSLCRACDVSVTTAQRVLTNLAREGLTVSRHGAGTFVADAGPPAIEVIASRRLSGQNPSYPTSCFEQPLMDGLCQGFAGHERRFYVSYIHFHPSSAEEVLEVCRVRRVEGLIVHQPDPEMGDVLRHVARRMPVVTLFRRAAGCPAGFVYCDPSAQVRRVLRRRLEAGRRTFVFMGLSKAEADQEPQFQPYAIAESAFLTTLEGAGIKPVMLLYGQEGRNAPFAHGRRDKLNALPDDAVIFCRNPHLAGAVHGEFGRFDLISYTESTASVERFGPHTSLIHMGLDVAGRAAAELLLKHPGEERAVRIRPRILEVGSRL